MARSDIRKDPPHTNKTTNSIIPQGVKTTVLRDDVSTEGGLDTSSSVSAIPAPEAHPLSEMKNPPTKPCDIVCILSNSPAPSDDCLQSLETLRSNAKAHRKVVDDGDGPSPELALVVINCKHVLEVADVKHRYGTYLKPYHEIWLASGAQEPFFKWLDEGDGRDADASKVFTDRSHCVPRNMLDKSMVQYCNEKDREKYRVIVQENKLMWANEQLGKRGKRQLVDTGNGVERWIFVIDQNGNLLLHKKTKGRFHHSSFLAGGPVRAAGRIVVEQGVIVSIGPNSGHYLTTWEQLLWAMEEFLGVGVEYVSSLLDRSSFDLDRS